MRALPLLLLLLGCATPSNGKVAQKVELEFSGDLALAAIARQVEFGPRPTGSAANAAARDWYESELTDLGWQVRRQTYAPVSDVSAQNVIAWRGEGRTIMLGAHFDTRLHSDRDDDLAKRQLPGPGANDGASGVAVLLELARVLNPEELGLRLCLALFDAEDNGDIEAWDWAMGSAHFVANPGEVPACDKPAATIVVDMVGDADLKIYRDFGSTASLQRAIWNQAEAMGVVAFSFTQRYFIFDDHTAFLDVGLPGLVIIDFEYPYWHTTEDTLDKVSAESLYAVGSVLEAWLKAGAIF